MLYNTTGTARRPRTSPSTSAAPPSSRTATSMERRWDWIVATKTKLNNFFRFAAPSTRANVLQSKRSTRFVCQT